MLSVSVTVHMLFIDWPDGVVELFTRCSTLYPFSGSPIALYLRSDSNFVLLSELSGVIHALGKPI